MQLGTGLAIAALGVAGWAAGAALAAGPALAATCSPGATCAPSTLSLSGATELASSGPNTLNAADFTATYYVQVWKNPSNTQCSECLSFVVYLSNTTSSSSNPPGAVAHITLGSFVGTTTDIGVTSGNHTSGSPALTGGSQSPNQVDRSSSGEAVEWDFTTASTEIGPGKSTVILQVDSNATSYGAGTLSAQNEGAAQGPAYAPVAPSTSVPDSPWVPGLGLMGGVAAGGFAFRRRTRPVS